jgi:ankyrin repeat protein
LPRPYIHNQTLIDKGFDIGDSLTWAIRNDNLEYVRFLVQKGARISARHRYGLPLCQVCEYAKPSMVKLLLDLGADVESGSEGYTPLQKAARNPRGEVIIRILLEAEADVNAVNGGNRTCETALHMAAVCNAGSARVLLEAGADVNWKESPLSPTALELACEIALWADDSFSTVELLLKAGARVDLRGAMDHRCLSQRRS